MNEKSSLVIRLATIAEIKGKMSYYQLSNSK
jgi:hypothetical protein